MPERPFKVSKKTVAAVVAILLALFTGAGVIDVTDDQALAPAPTATAAAPRAAPPAATPPPLAGAEHEDLSEPGDVDLGTLRGAAPSSDTLPGCESRFNTHNFSSRNGTAVRVIGLHYTVSPNVTGWADVNANVDFLNRVTTKASAGAIIDGEGHCAYTVPLALKAWTEANGNPFTFGIEFVATGNEGKLTAAALAKGGQVIAAVAARSNIPLQIGDVTGCNPNRAGLVDHAMYGPCGGGHHDLRPMWGTSIVPKASDNAIAVGPLLKAARAAAAPADPLTKPERAAADTLIRERAVAKRHGGWDKVDASHLARAVDAKDSLRRANLRLHAAAAKSGWDRLSRRGRHALIHRLI